MVPIDINSAGKADGYTKSARVQIKKKRNEKNKIEISAIPNQGRQRRSDRGARARAARAAGPRVTGMLAPTAPPRKLRNFVTITQRSSSLTDLGMVTQNHQTAITVPVNETSISREVMSQEDNHYIAPPPWQRVPNRNNKKRKFCDSSPDVENHHGKPL
ncbi:hypothetical protein EVAR_80823_1 [Eumeta japonica]|uniref:Uncharacterized protein n=1 Tax=Eumeta variegata TaxID=151549 RepID=A0A4C1WGA3_EUMVA|nr:hypothetical protein EVAR_80823_1 [Eumeta japonica]